MFDSFALIFQYFASPLKVLAILELPELPEDDPPMLSLSSGTSVFKE